MLMVCHCSRADPYCRLRVPKYLKVYELFFLAVFLALYYAVLVKRDMYHVTAEEVLLMLWLAAFAYDELGQYIDAGLTLYTTGTCRDTSCSVEFTPMTLNQTSGQYGTSSSSSSASHSSSSASSASQNTTSRPSTPPLTFSPSKVFSYYHESPPSSASSPSSAY